LSGAQASLTHAAAIEREALAMQDCEGALNMVCLRWMRRAYSTLIRLSNQKMLLRAERNGYHWQTIWLKYIFTIGES
jgi:hypothetical protein